MEQIQKVLITEYISDNKLKEILELMISGGYDETTRLMSGAITKAPIRSIMSGAISKASIKNAPTKRLIIESVTPLRSKEQHTDGGEYLIIYHFHFD